MKRSRVSYNINSWGDFLKIVGILGIIIGIFVSMMGEAVGMSILEAALISLIAGILFKGFSIIVEAADRYLGKLKEEEWKEASKGPEVGD